MQKIIVSDTSCTGYLIKINLLNLLQTIYGEIIVPQAVHDEILDLEVKGHSIIEFKSAEWIKVYPAIDLKNVKEYQHILDRGELEAISIAIDLDADLLIIDEKLGRTIAASIGFDVTGLVGILITAKNKCLIPSIKKALDKVILLGGRISKHLYNIALKSCNEL